jgi:hypothetical protein
LHNSNCRHHHSVDRISSFRLNPFRFLTLFNGFNANFFFAFKESSAAFPMGPATQITNYEFSITSYQYPPPAPPAPPFPAFHRSQPPNKLQLPHERRPILLSPPSHIIHLIRDASRVVPLKAVPNQRRLICVPLIFQSSHLFQSSHFNRPSLSSHRAHLSHHPQ